MKRIFLFLAITLCLSLPVFLAIGGGKAYAKDGNAEIFDPCSASNPTALLSLLDRPTFSDSACSAPLGHAVLELGFQHANVRGEGGGTADNYPEAELRYGLPGANEFKVLASNYTSQRAGLPEEASFGLSATSVGFKHELGYNAKWLGAVEAILTLPSGNDAFGSRGLGATFSGIAAYSLTDQIGLSLQLGVGSLTDPVSAGGGRFTSFNQFLTVTWDPVERLQFYGEVCGQTKTSHDEGAGYNFDGGIQYIVAHWLEVDAEEGVRLSGNLGGFTHYYGAGMGFLF
ncbi:MAG: hypothetical protein M0018_05175 [Nitrospiraceae bacterium]|nr:hypothetical protein [Nitrospiraceae bacterium]